MTEGSKSKTAHPKGGSNTCVATRPAASIFPVLTRKTALAPSKTRFGPFFQFSCNKAYPAKLYVRGNQTHYLWSAAFTFHCTMWRLLRAQKGPRCNIAALFRCFSPSISLFVYEAPPVIPGPAAPRSPAQEPASHSKYPPPYRCSRSRCGTQAGPRRPRPRTDRRRWLR